MNWSRSIKVAGYSISSQVRNGWTYSQAPTMDLQKARTFVR